MKITADELTHSYRNMSDGELLSLNRNELTEVARACQDRELKRRGLELAGPVAPTDEPLETADGPWISAGVFRYADEAEVVVSVLQSAGIPAEVEDARGEYIWMGSSLFKASRVLIPEPLLEEAHALIEAKAAEEERAAGAEAETARKVITARYEDGVFKPVEPVDLEEGAEVEISLPR